MSEKMKVVFESNSWNEGFARMTAAAFILHLNPNMEELEDIRTAVSEAVTNAIIHGYRDTKGEVTMEMEITGSVIFISVHDDGCGIADIERARQPMYSGAPEMERSGMGFSFMEAFMDELVVESQVNVGTTVKMKKELGRQHFE
ncbi:MAG: anti-sigma F factor [Lachnospiraceae bacterium]